MIDRILIQTGLRRDRVAGMAGDRLVELAVLEHRETLPVDSICLGRVRRVAQELDAAFVDLDGQRDGMLAGRDAPGGRRRPLNARVHEGQALLVQLRRLTRDDKGPRLTARPQLAGRCLVFQPDGSEPQLSGRITGGGRRRQLTALLAELCPAGEGAFTARTSAAEASDDMLRAEAGKLRAQWQEIGAEAGRARPPAVLWRPDPLHQVLATLLTPAVVSIELSEQAAVPRLRALLQTLAPFALDRLAVHRSGETLFEASGVEAQIETAQGIRVALPSGGWLAIEPTTALTAIDVNAGAVDAAVSAGRVAIVTNLEAAQAIADQLRLRDIGGIVVIDFMRMHGRGESRRLMEAFDAALSEDRAEVRLLGPSELGLVEMTRQRLGLSPAMRGEVDGIDAALERAMALAQSGAGHSLALHAAPGRLDSLADTVADLCESFRDRTGCSLNLLPEPGYADDRIEVRPA